MATLHFAGWHVRPMPSFETRVARGALWWLFSAERRALLASQEQARMDEVHESRASRRVVESVSKLDRLDGLDTRGMARAVAAERAVHALNPSHDADIRKFGYCGWCER